MMWWWFILYYPIMFALLFLGRLLEGRYPPDSVECRRADIALGCFAGVAGRACGLRHWVDCCAKFLRPNGPADRSDYRV